MINKEIAASRNKEGPLRGDTLNWAKHLFLNFLQMYNINRYHA